MGDYLQGDFGVNLRQQRPVTELVRDAAPVTLRLTIIALVIETVVGIFIGVLAGLRKDKFIDNLVRFGTVAADRVPDLRLRHPDAALRRPGVRPLPA